MLGYLNVLKKNFWSIKEVSDNLLMVKMNSNKVNCMNPKFFSDFHQCFDTIENQYSNHSIILGSENEKVFSSGIDLNHLVNCSQKEMQDLIDSLNVLHNRVLYFKNPIISYIEGSVVAGGLSLALATDYRFMKSEDTEKLVCAMNPTGLNLTTPSSIHFVVNKKLHPKKSNELLLFGLQYEKGDIKSIENDGIINETVKNEEDCIEKTQLLLKRIKPDAFKTQKTHIKMEAENFYANFGKEIDENFLNLLMDNQEPINSMLLLQKY